MMEWQQMTVYAEQLQAGGIELLCGSKWL